MNETVHFLIEALQNSSRNNSLELEINNFAEENHLVFEQGSSRFVLIDYVNDLVFKIAINSFGIDQNKTEASHSGEPYVAKVLENYNNVIIVAPRYEMLTERIHNFLHEPDFYKSLVRGQSQTNDILFDVQDSHFENRQEAIENEDDFIMIAMDDISALPSEYPKDIHEDNFGIDFKNKIDTPIMLDNGIDYAFCEKHYDVVSNEVFTIYELLTKLFENQSVVKLVQKLA